jgi:hypothetical protein
VVHDTQQAKWRIAIEVPANVDAGLGTILGTVFGGTVLGAILLALLNRNAEEAAILKCGIHLCHKTVIYENTTIETPGLFV